MLQFMSVMEAVTLDMSQILLGSYELADMIKHSAAAADYEYWRGQVNQHPDAPRLVREFNKAKDLFEDCQRFGHFHPNYHEAKDKLDEAQAALDSLEPVQQFKLAEAALDELLHEISEIIARSVSDTIKVPGGSEPEGGGCSSGGSCSGKCS